jgi:hypothetical protein
MGGCKNSSLEFACGECSVMLAPVFVHWERPTKS